MNSSPHQSPSASRAPHILLIDDDPLITRMYALGLERHGYRVALAGDGAEGLGAVARERPDLILLDIMMPKMNGVETLKALKADEHTAGIPVIILTNLGDKPKDVESAKRLGAKEYLVKADTTPKRLAAKVAEVLKANGRGRMAPRPMPRAAVVAGVGTLAILAIGTGLIFISRDQSGGAPLFVQMRSLFTRNHRGQATIQGGIEQSSLVRTFTHPAHGFSFRYPEGFGASNFQETDASGEEGEMILVQPAKEVGPPQGGPTSRYFSMQIFLKPFDEPGPLTVERLEQDLPDLQIENPETVEFGASDPPIRALSFRSRDLSGVETQEVWFVRDGTLYQVSAPASFADQLREILKTWSWQP